MATKQKDKAEQTAEEKEMTKSPEYERFDATMRRLISVPHSKIKAKLDAEKAAKKRKPKRTSASGRASGGKD
jgi:hypothetical protein